MEVQSTALDAIAVKHLFSSPLVTAELPPETVADINPILRTMILERAQTQPSAQASNEGGWQSDAGITEWGGAPVKIILDGMRTLLARITLYLDGGELRRGDIEWKINGWANVSRKGHANAAHVHPGAYWSAVYYVAVDNDDDGKGGELKLFDPRGCLPRMYAPILRMGIQGYTTAGNAELHKPKTGQIVIFPSWLSHAVLPYNGDGERISLAFKFFDLMTEAAPTAPVSDAVLQLRQARDNCAAVLAEMPNDPIALYIMGVIECKLGNTAAGEAWLKQSLAIRPNAAETLCHYGLTLMDRHAYTEALEVFQRAAKNDPGNAEVFYHMGNCCKMLGDMNAAVAAFDRAITMKPEHPEALNNLGTLFSEQGLHHEAIALFQRSIDARPDYVMPLNNMGLALVGLGRLDEAETFYRRGLAIKPDYPEICNNLGILARLRGDFAQAADWLHRALAAQPHYPEAYNNLGNALMDAGDFDAAIAAHERAIALRDTPDNHHNYALVLLAAGHWREGWREYERRWQSRQLSGVHRNFRQPTWRGETAKPGQVLFLHGEQGFGDSLQFCRYAPLAATRGWRVALEVPGALVNLMQSLAGVDQVIAFGAPLPDFDMHCPFLSLPLAFDTRPDTIPASIPYLSPNEDAVAEWAEKLLPHKQTRKIGLVWAGKPRATPDMIALDGRRSMAPEFLLPLMDVPGVTLFSLQKGGPLAPEGLTLIDRMAECADFAATGALIANLDLVISVDTAVAHLAAAIGKPVWLLNRYDSCWRWLRGKTDTGWYPNMRIFNQPNPGDWAAVIADVVRALGQ